MRNHWRTLVLAAVCHSMAGIGVAAAQTVIVREAPPESAVELVLNGNPVGSAAADDAGDAVIPMNLSALIGRSEMDANVLVDICGELRRVQVVERGMRPPPQGQGCDRREIIGVFFVRRVTSLVLHVGGPTPTILLVQGPYDLRERGPARAWSTSPTGLVLFGGAGLAGARDAVDMACGNVSECSGDGAQGTFTVGAAFWITRFLGAEASYVRPGPVDARGTGDTFRFSSVFDADVATVAGMVGVPIGPVRLYGKVGTNYQQSTFSTTQIHDPQTIVIDDVPQTVEGITQTIALRTAGWGLLAGGGIETWVTPSFGLYAELSRAALRGDAVDNGEGASDEALTSLFIGVRIRIGR